MSYIGKSTPISIIDNVSKSAGGTFGGDVTVNGTLTATSLSGDGSNLTGVESDLVFDTTPQLGGNLDLNSKAITGTGHIEPLAGTTYTPPSGSGSDTSTTTAIALTRGKEISIGHNGYIRNLLQANSSGQIQIGDGATGLFGDILMQPGSNNGVKLGFDGANYKLETTTTGIKVTGTIAGASDAEIKTSPIRIHTNTINQNTTIDSSENAVSGGPITIASGVTVTVSGDWTVV